MAAVEIVEEKTARVIERLGKFHRVLYPGLGFRIPFIERVADVLSLQIQLIKADVQVKTHDNVFVTLPVTVQYRVQEDRVRQACYELDNPKETIQALVLNAIRSIVAGMQLEDVFSSRSGLEAQVQQLLAEELGKYGYSVVNVVVDNPQLSKELEVAFNDVMAATRRQEAATADAKALQIRLVGEATAQADGMKIQAAAITEFRKTLAAGLATAITGVQESAAGLTGADVLRYFVTADTNDTIRDAASKGATIVVATPNSSDGLYATLAR